MIDWVQRFVGFGQMMSVDQNEYCDVYGNIFFQFACVTCVVDHSNMRSSYGLI